MRGIDDLFTVYYSVTDCTAGDGVLPTTTLRSVQGLMRHGIVGQMPLFRLRSRLANYLQSAIESSTSSTPAISAQAPVTRSVNNSPKDMRRAYNSVGISDGNADCPARRPLPRSSEYHFQVARFQAEMRSCGDSVYSLTYLDLGCGSTRNQPFGLRDSSRTVMEFRLVPGHRHRVEVVQWF